MLGSVAQMDETLTATRVPGVQLVFLALDEPGKEG